MTKYNCKVCGEEYTKKNLYTAHLNTYNDIDLVGEHINVKVPKPIIKWVGGKTQILYTLLKEFPTEINNYHELFLGGGSVLIALLSYIKAGIITLNGNIYAYDLNKPLIYVYKNIQCKYTSLYKEITKLVDEYNNCKDGAVNRKPTDLIEATQSRENYYYWIRDKYNKLSNIQKNSPLGSAMFIFLNKTCFRGLFRVGPNGFNVPYGHYKNPEIINDDHLEKLHYLFQGVIFKDCDYELAMDNISCGDYVYLDPPYAPETTTSFVKYTEEGFGIDKHIKLFERIHELSEQGVLIMHSNADVTLVRENFSNVECYKVSSIMCRRAINSKKPESKASEVIIKNY